jgi:hypothetical protein
MVYFPYYHEGKECSLLQYIYICIFFIVPTTAQILFSCVPPTCFGCYFQPSSGSQHQMVQTAAVYPKWHVIHSLLHSHYHKYAFQVTIK